MSDHIEHTARVLYESSTGYTMTNGKPWEQLTDTSRDSQRRLARALDAHGLLATPTRHPTTPFWIGAATGTTLHWITTTWSNEWALLIGIPTVLLLTRWMNRPMNADD